jgi:flagellar biosynthetic protein FlhB
MADDLSTSQERTEPATPKKKEDARRKGTVARSVELNSAFILLMGLLVLAVAGPTIGARVASFAQTAFVQSAQTELTVARAYQLVVQSVLFLGGVVLPVLLVLMAVGLISSFSQVGFLFSVEPLEIKWNRLNPFTGIRKILGSRRSLMELVKNLFKVVIIAAVAYLAIENVLAQSVLMMEQDAGEILEFMVSASLGMGWKVGLALLVLAVFDYLFQRYEYERELRMTKQEVKEEVKMTEGDPLVRGRIRKVQKQIAYKRMMQQVPKADVVITNPVHIAVALQYDRERMHAPTVVAKGAEYLAQRIKQVAQEHNVPIVEDRPLARALYQAVDIGEQIPEKLFHAVAQILAYIYRIRRLKVQPSVN